MKLFNLIPLKEITKKELDKDISAIVVTINLTRDINIPKNSVDYIASELVGSSFIVIERGNSKDLMKPGDTLSTRVETGLLGDVKAQLNPTVAKVQEVLDALQTSLSTINSTLSPSTRADLQASIANLNKTTAGMSKLMDPELGSLSKSLNNMIKNLVIWLVIGLVLMTVFNQFNQRQQTAQAPIEYSQFIEEVKQGNVAKVTIGAVPRQGVAGENADDHGKGNDDCRTTHEQPLRRVLPFCDTRIQTPGSDPGSCMTHHGQHA